MKKITKTFSEKHRYSGGGVAIIKSGQILLEEYYGDSNRKLKIKNDLDTVFRIGSITKEFTATLIYILSENGKLNFDVPVAKYLSTPQKWKKIKIRHLLEHSAGIENQITYLNYKRGAFKDLSDKVIYEWLDGITIFRDPNYGHGFMVNSEKGFKFIGHNGFTPGFVSSHFFSYKNKTHAILLNNDERFTENKRDLNSIAYKLILTSDGRNDFSKLRELIGL